MLVMTAKLNPKKLALILGILILSMITLAVLGGRTGDSAAPTASITENDDRVQYLSELGWQVDASPKETMQVLIPKESNEVFDRYNTLQKTQGFDLAPLAGKTVLRYVYHVTDSPEDAPIYATLLVYKNRIVGGDITEVGPNGGMKPLAATAKGQ